MLLLIVGLTPAVVRAGEAEKPHALDWSAWEHLPVFFDGRIMPLNTFARLTVEKITGRANPRLAPAEGADAGATGSKVLFPEEKPRKFKAAELLYSWLVEPERWEQVPFLKAGYEPLRKEVFGLPSLDAQGNHLKYVSPAQVHSRMMAIQMRLADAAVKRRQAEANGTKYVADDVDVRLNELLDAYRRFRLLTFKPGGVSDERGLFVERLSGLVKIWNAVGSDIQGISEADSRSSTMKLVSEAEDSLQKLIDLAKQGDLTPAKAEPLAVTLKESTAALAKAFAEHDQRLFTSPPKDWSEAQLKRVRSRMHAVAVQMAEMAREANEAQIALYDSGMTLRLVPALNPAALEEKRDTANEAQPWLSLPALLDGSDSLLAGYPKKTVDEVRKAYREAAAAYVDRGSSQRAEQFNGAMKQLAASLRTLGEEVEPLRRELPIEQRDEALLAVTAYPAPDAMWAEVHYYEFEPFFWSCAVGVGALVCFGLAFGVLRKPMFWLGMAVLVAAQLFTIYGFVLRVIITGWAPVTNMFETVMFVALVVSLLGAAFAVAPIVWPGLRSAWRLSAIPLTWEAGPLSDPQLALMPSRRWDRLGWAMLVPRIGMALMVFEWLARTKYGAGNGYTIVALWPRTSVGTSVPTLNDVTVWLVGILMLASAMWYVPRAVLAGLAGLATIPGTLARTGIRKPLEQAVARKPFALAGASVGVLTALVACYAPVLDKDINPLMPVLRDNFWLTLHVLTITASYGAGALAWGLGNIALGYYLFGTYREPLTEELPEGHRPAGPAPHGPLGRRAPEQCATLGTFMYKSIQVAVLLLAAGTILGGLWADVAWGRFWSWDSKEVWALVSLLIYLAVLHGRFAGWFGNFGLAVGSVVGATSILMAWYGVNYWLGSGLHSYGGGAGGGRYVLLCVALNWLLIVPPAVRYELEKNRHAESAGT